jgi:hypothetical protein
MSMMKVFRGFGAAIATCAVVGCHSLDVANNNDPDRTRALADATALQALGAGSFRTFFNAWGSLRGAGVLSTQARSYSASWNNGNMNFYSGIDIAASDETTPPDTWTRNTRAWQNDPNFAGRTSIEAFWTGGLDESGSTRPGFYSALSAANSALFAIRKNNIVITNASGTKRLEAVTQLMQGMALAMISLNYDKGYYVDENSVIETLQYISRKAMRDSAVSKLQAAAAIAGANTFTTLAAWTNNGPTFTNADIVKIANTWAALTLAWYPRDDAETGGTVMTTADWQKVANFAAAGMSSGSAPVDIYFIGDGASAWINELMWFGLELLDGGRLHTRVAHFLDPSTQKDPYPLSAGGNPKPVLSADKRLGDGTFGDLDTEDSFGTRPKTANAGTDFAWTEVGEVFRPDRGFYHQSNMNHIRYDESGVMDPKNIYGGFGKQPVLNASVNDLVWAEALLRVGGPVNLANAATLINKTRVTRGGLPAATAADLLGSPADGPCMSTQVLAKDGSGCTLWSKLLYELEIELIGLGPTPFYNQRHLPVVKGGGAFDGSKLRYIQGLIPGTPREMPVPAKELGVKGEALYTFGGATPHSPAP